MFQLLQKSYQALKSDTRQTFRKLYLKSHCQSSENTKLSDILLFFLSKKHFVVPRVKIYCSSLLQGSDHPHYIHINSLQDFSLEQTDFSHLRQGMGTASAPGYFPSLQGCGYSQSALERALD